MAQTSYLCLVGSFCPFFVVSVTSAQGDSTQASQHKPAELDPAPDSETYKDDNNGIKSRCEASPAVQGETYVFTPMHMIKK